MSTTATSNAAKQYQQNAVLTAPKEKLVVMLYDGALRFLERAGRAMAKKDVAATGEMISRAFAIISELRSTLNYEEGGEIAINLDALYGFVQDRIIKANRQREMVPLEEAREILVKLREGWNAIVSSS